MDGHEAIRSDPFARQSQGGIAQRRAWVQWESRHAGTCVRHKQGVAHGG